MIKLISVYITRFLLRLLYVLPINKNQWMFIAYHGKSYSCNPKYIYQYVIKNMNAKIKPIWVLNNTATEELEGVCIVGHRSLKFFYYLMTSKVIISNNGVGSFYPKRKDQIVINTWHGGGAYKRVGTETGKVEKKIALLISKQTDIFVSSSRMFTDVMTKSTKVPRQKFLEIGMPRNDLFYMGTADVVAKVKRYYGIASDTKIILYAPTFRGNMHEEHFNNQLDVMRVKKAVEERFGGNWIFAVRMHYFLDSPIVFKDTVDMSDYQDMQELLCAADVFITDYSSTIWDYSLTGKPGFLFVPDIDQYRKERNFYTAPETWAYPLVRTNEELKEAILKYNEADGRKKIKQHHDLLGNCESGRASELVTNGIVKWIEGE